MSYNSPEIRTFRGRYAQRNSFEVPDGALEVASNVTVGSDFIVTKRRGFYAYYVPATQILNLANYENTLVSIYSDKFAYYSNTGSEPNLLGSQTVLTNETGVTVSNTIKPRTAEANENLYSTSDNGLLKLTAYNSQVAYAGSPAAQDLFATFATTTQGGFLGSDQVVGYRLVFGRKDQNDNLILGSPGDIATITNATVTGVAYNHAGGGPWTVTVTSTAHGLITGQYITVMNATDVDANGTYQITVTGVNTFDYTVTTGNPSSGTLDYYNAEAIFIEATIPDRVADVSQGYFAQLYRSDQASSTTGFLSTYKLVAQRDLTAPEISAKVIFFTDSLPDILRGVELYTNENTQEGESQANGLPPKAKDITLFKSYLFYGNVTIRPYVNLQMIDNSLISSGNTFGIRVVSGVTTTDKTYVARSGLGNTLTWTNSITGVGPFTVTYSGHNFSTGDTLYISNVTGGTFANQTVTISGTTATDFTFALTGTGTPTALWFEGRTNGTNYIFTVSGASGATGIADTAQALVKAINTDTSSLVYARYTSDYTSVPGLISIFAEGFPDYIRLQSNAGSAFNPTVPASYSSSVQSSTSNLQHVLYISKLSEPEAVPLVNFLPVGSENKAILRILTLRDSVIVIKEDGVYRLSGDSPQNFVVTILDSTVICAGTDTPCVINNQVAMLSNTGVVLITESAVNIISRKIEQDIAPILGRSDSLSHGQAYESDRLYLLTCTRPNDSAISITHVYNTLTDEWSTWDKYFTCGVVGPKDTLFICQDTTNYLLKERKSQTRVDFADQWYASTITAVASNKKTITFTTLATPERGDMLVLGNVINKIFTSPNLVGVNTYQADLQDETTLVAADTPILYKSITSIVKTVPFHAGLTGRAKQFSQVQLHFRNASCSRLSIYFIGDYFLGSDETDWVAIWSRAGWAYFPWGFDFFGQPDGIDLPIGTTPAPICRIYVPIQQQRTTFIQTVLTHSEAGENIGLQAQSWSVRAYGERVTR